MGTKTRATWGVIAVLGAGAGAFMGGCSQSSVAPQTAAKADNLHEQAVASLNDFRQADPDLQRFFSNSVAYVIFPNVKTGAVGLGGTYGRGEVYQQGQRVGYADITQVTAGAQLGGERFAELIFFQDPGTYARFRDNQWNFDARTSAVAASRGASRAVDYASGVAVFTHTEGGLMAQAAVGGQRLRYQPANDMNGRMTNGY